MAFSLTWLPDVLKSAGLKVATIDGWKDRGRGDVGSVRGVLCHHTAGSRAGNMPSIRTLIHGRSDLPGPLSQLGLGRDGTFYVIAAGRCNHAGKGSWQGITTGNSSLIGIEAENTGTTKDFPWPEVQMDAYRRGVAAILAHIGRGAEFCAGHREYALPKGRKNDPLFDMAAFRAGVREILSGAAPGPIVIPIAEPEGQRRRTLRRGMDDPLVREIQAMLGVDPIGTFGPRTEAAVRRFQREHGLVPDGIVGPKTWTVLDAAHAASPPPAVVIVETPVSPSLATPPASPVDGEAMPLADAHAALVAIGAARPVAQWDEALTRAVQRALAELFLLNPNDDVDGKAGPRTQNAWRLFREAAQLGAGPSIDAASAQKLVAESKSRDAFIGKPIVALEPDFVFRRNRRSENREHSAEAIVRVAKAQGLTRPQIAYVLATAEHESDRFATLEEYASGAAYEGRGDLGNTRPGDGRRFKGRGFVQLTGRNNYTAYAKRSGVKILDLPVIPMNWPSLSTWILVDGMTRGAYTGKRLDQFVNDERQDFRNARRVVNGIDQAERIANLAEAWLEKIS